MNDKNDGGPAFPRLGQEVNFGDGWLPSQDGMTLRDWLAGQALQGVIATGSWDDESVAKCAYSLADAMLRERDR